MQIDIRLVPVYEKPFEKQFPRLADLLRRTGRQELVEKETSFYEMADALEMIAESPDTPSGIREAVSPHEQKIMAIKEIARDHLLARRLNEMDRELYRMEDAFEDLEASL
ncbi:MAG: hypothetical protein B5M55_05490 [Desulfococcus sp. 4484_242]|nr:MAG: hypothetical protein B5M55_05490 [Desulfococcus sp. 4484_242]